MKDIRPAAAVQTRRFFYLLFAIGAIAVCAHAQTPASAPAAPPAPASTKSLTAAEPPASITPVQGSDADAPTIKVGVNEVDLVFTVTDKHGHFIKGLNLSDFGLLDNRMQPEKVLHFTQQTDLPLRVGIMLDTSSSIRERFQFEQQSAVQFLMQTLHRNGRAPSRSRASTMQIDLTQPFTNNIDQLDQGISKLRPGGGTASRRRSTPPGYDQMLTLRENGVVRKAIVLTVSDGDDTSIGIGWSRTTPSRSASGRKRLCTPSPPTSPPAATRETTF